MNLQWRASHAIGKYWDYLASPAGFLALLARAVGSGVGMNLLSIVIPCHRVLNTAAPYKPYTVGKYGGSEAIKRILLRLELSDKNGNLRKGVPRIIL